jgi:hypothetical protein
MTNSFHKKKIYNLKNPLFMYSKIDLQKYLDIENYIKIESNINSEFIELQLFNKENKYDINNLKDLDRIFTCINY